MVHYAIVVFAIATSLGTSSSSENSSSSRNWANRSAMAWPFIALGVLAFKSYYDNCNNHDDILPDRMGCCRIALMACVDTRFCTHDLIKEDDQNDYSCTQNL